MTEEDGRHRSQTGGQDLPPRVNRHLKDRFEMAVARSAAADGNSHLLPNRLCQAVIEVTGMEGAAVSVYLGGDVAIPIGASDLAATTGETLQFTLREGPCFSSYHKGEPVLLADLNRTDSQAWSDWPNYAEQLIRHTPYRAVFAYPLWGGDGPIGSLSLYNTWTGHPDFLTELTDIASLITRHLLDADQAADADGDPEYRWLDSPTAMRRRRVWLAQGITLQANHITPGDALQLLRAHAFSTDRMLDDVADDIVSGRLPVPELESRQ